LPVLPFVGGGQPRRRRDAFGRERNLLDRDGVEAGAPSSLRREQEQRDAAPTGRPRPRFHGGY